jgi:hypothetical protein
VGSNSGIVARREKNPSTTRTAVLNTVPTRAGLGSNLDLTNHIIKAFIKCDVKLHAFLNSIVNGEDIITVLMEIKLISFTQNKFSLISRRATYFCSRLKYIQRIVSNGGMETVSPG